MKRKGFTLAEIIITLSIVGIVAAYTIPLLVNIYQKQIYVAQLKHSYSTIQEFFKQYLADQGVMELGQTPLFDGNTWNSDTRQSYFDNVVHKYFKVFKACKALASPVDLSCMIKESYLDNSSKSNFFTFGDYGFCTIDKTCFSIILQDSCQPDYSHIGNMKTFCGFIRIDTNGAAPPNIYGRDFWNYFDLGHDGRLYPSYGIEYAKYNDGVNWATGSYYWQGTQAPTACGTLGSTNLINVRGFGCLARIIEEGWEMNY